MVTINVNINHVAAAKTELLKIINELAIMKQDCFLSEKAILWWRFIAEDVVTAYHELTFQNDVDATIAELRKMGQFADSQDCYDGGIENNIAEVLACIDFGKEECV